ncbi:MAG: glycosyltransferase family 4 protein [Candidatus Eremiobacteraeota bacterium]|nr:glycosyltransferase family 4 protein [Candidatus Eremiobacteraeota bacterium]
MLRVAVDGFNLAADRRGMGRYARVVLDTLGASSDIALTVVVQTRRDLPLASDLATFRTDYVTLGEARRRRFDATWFPWNGMRFRFDGGSVVTIHDIFAFRYPHRNPIARRREQRPIRRAVEQASVLTTVSKFSAREIVAQFGFPLKRLTVASPVPSEFWKPVSPAQRAPYFLFIAGPEPRKNAAMLFSAFARAFPRQDFQLVIAGTLSIADEQILRQSGIAYAHVAPSDEELRVLYSGSTALLMPSRDEGYGLPAVEAMACGAAVIAADRGGLPEACDGAARLLSPDDSEQWQDALREVAANAERREELRARSLARASRIDRSQPGKVIAERLRRAAEAVP